MAQFQRGINDLYTWCTKNNRLDILTQWCNEKNNPLTPSDVHQSSKKMVFWKCEKGHVYNQRIDVRTLRGYGCPVCIGRRVVSGVNDLESWCKENGNRQLLSEWNTEKNGKIEPNMIHFSSKTKVWWKCNQCSHEWVAPVGNRSTRKTGCPICKRQKVQRSVNDLETWCKANNRMAILSEWDLEKNNPYIPNNVSYGSHLKVWWKGQCGHEWESEIRVRTLQNAKCPVCYKNQHLVEHHQIKTAYSTDFETWCSQNDKQQLLSEWDFEKNANLKPYMLSFGSNKKVWWIDSFGHTWQSTVKSRAQGSNCPVCRKEKQYIKNCKNNLQSWCIKNNKLEILSSWDSEKNGDLEPSMLSYASKSIVWWIGECGHSWDMPVASRTVGEQKCPFCSNRRLGLGINDLETWCKENNRTDLLDEWDFEKNSILLPSMVVRGSKANVWWKCHECGHSWKQHIYSRTRGIGCPKCASEQHSSFCEQALFFYVKKAFPDAINGSKGVIDMELDIYIPSLRIAIEYDGEAWHNSSRKAKSDSQKNLKCSEKGIELIRVREPKLKEIAGCTVFLRNDSNSNTSLDLVISEVLGYLHVDTPVHVDTKKDTPEILELYSTKKIKNSLLHAYPQIAKEWHPYKNASLTPDKISQGSPRQVWWLGNCGHEWQSSVSNRTKLGTGCPICSGNTILPGFNDFETWCKQNNREDLLKEWNYEKNKGISPNSVSRTTHKEVWWTCSKGHDWRGDIGSRTQTHRKGYSCPICSGRRVVSGINDFESWCKQNNRIQLLSEWDHKRNSELHLFPNRLTPHSNRKVWWKCEMCRAEWVASVDSRTSGRNCCSFCAGKRLAVGINDFETWCRKHNRVDLLEEWNCEKKCNKHISGPNYISFDEKSMVEMRFRTRVDD